MTLSSVPSSALWALIAANTLSWLGSSLRVIALPWLVLQATGSGTQTALVAASAQVGHLLSLLLFTRFVDVLGYRRVSILTDYASAVAVALLPVLAYFGAVPLPVILLLAFIQALFDAPGVTARASLVPDLVARTPMTLAKANAISEVLESCTSWLGPLLAGVLVAWLGPLNVLWLDAVSFLLSGLLMAALVPGEVDDRREKTAPGPDAMPDRWAGWRFLLRDVPLRNVFLSSIVFSASMSALFGLLLPLYARNTGNAATLGVLVGAFGGGAVLGAIAYGRWGHRWSIRRTFLVGVGGLSLMFVTLPFDCPGWVMVAVCLLAGLIAGPNGPVIATMQHERAPEAIRAQVLGAASMSTLLASPAGLFMLGVALEHAGWQTTTAALAALFLITLLVVMLEPRWKEVEEASQ
ncbi:MAG: MFS transporter [Deinococcus sp.]|nr:MFS transporter [Deinococcus sp.]